MKKHTQKKREEPQCSISVEEELGLMYAAAEAHPNWEVLPDGGIRRTGYDGPDTPEKLLTFATKATHPRCSNGRNPFVTRLDYKDPLSARRVMLIKSSTPCSKLA